MCVELQSLQTFDILNGLWHFLKGTLPEYLCHGSEDKLRLAQYLGQKKCWKLQPIDTRLFLAKFLTSVGMGEKVSMVLLQDGPSNMAFNMLPLQAGLLLDVHFTASSVLLDSDPTQPLSLIQMTLTSYILMRVLKDFVFVSPV